MKNLLLILFSAISCMAMGQAPAEINYQGIARNAVGNVIPQKNISIRLSIRDANGTGPVQYQEVRKITTSNLGMFNIAIGSAGASNVLGTLGGVTWESGMKFLQVELDPNGGNSFMDLGAGQFLSVPYAMYAERSKPAGPASGDLTGNFPNPDIAVGKITTPKLANNSVTTGKLRDSAVTLDKIASGVIPITLPPSGNAGGELAGVYPNPQIGTGVITSAKLADNAVTTTKLANDAITNAKLADNAVGTTKISDASITAAKLAPGVIPTSFPASGPAGGELTGTYPTPQIAAGVITSTKLADNAITTSKITDASVTAAKLATNAVTTEKVTDGSITAAKLAPGVIPTSLPLDGTAGGELTGTYPNPQIGTGVITGSKIATNAITTAKLADNAITTEKVTDGSITAAKLAPGVIPTSLPLNGTAGGELTGTYPNPQVGVGVITSAKLADNAVTTIKITDASVTAAKLAPGVIPTSFPASGAAGGELTGTYPNPQVGVGVITSAKLADNAVTTAKVTDGSITAAKLAPGVIPTSLPLDGTAGGELTGTYPNPQIGTGVITSSKIATSAITTAKLADNAITTIKITDGSVTAAKLAAGIIPTTLPPSGNAGGELTGTYPNPVIGAGVITTSKVADNAITTAKVLDGSITMAKLGPDVVFGSGGSPSGSAGGDLSGNYPSPNLKAGSVTISKIDNGAVITPKLADAAVTSQKIADNAITTEKVLDGSITLAKLAPGVIGGSLPTGAAGGELSGTYPNPTIGANVITSAKLADNAVTTAKLSDNAITTSKITDATITAAKLAPGVIPTFLPPGGNAGGELSGTYPNPTIGAGVITSAKLADNAVTTAKLSDNAITTAKLTDGSITAAKLATGIIPTALPPTGNAGGDLAGSFPNPTISKLNGIAMSSTAPASGQILKYNGTAWAPAADNTGSGFALPYAASASNPATMMSITNQGAGTAIQGTNSSNNGNTAGVLGTITIASHGISSAGVRGIHQNTGVEGYGVWGSHDGTGIGVYGSSTDGFGIQANSINNVGIMANSETNAAGYFTSNDLNSMGSAVVAYKMGIGDAVTAINEGGNGVWGVSYVETGAGVLGYNIGGGEGVVGRSLSNTAAGVVGRNDGTFGGVQGIGAGGDAVGVYALVNIEGFENGTALVAEVEGAGPGNTAVFKAAGANVARIDNTGKGFFNGGMVVGGADVAEYFQVDGERSTYEAGDVLIISADNDRSVVKSNSAYSTLVAGVFATKPGLMLTEENAEKNQLDKMVPMGVIGVIPTKVCLEGGPIKRGDLIVTSSQTGIAMKADLDKVRPGQVIGKALQEYNGTGSNKINVLVSVK